MLAAESTQPPELPGYRFGRRLGEGGMAEVWAATQLSLDREVAVKLVATDGRMTPEMAGRFEREARTIARLEHPHIVGIFEVGRSPDGRMFYTMPLLPNGDLGRRNLRFAAREIVRVLRAVLEALQFAHANGVIHRDVKPANILFDRNDRPLLADFGIALTQTERKRVTSQRQTLGSAGYMSPEQARSGDVDARADLYSLGVVAFELLTGDLPFHGADALAVALAHIEQPIPRLPPQHSAWQGFIDRALGKTPAQRFASAAEMLEALAAVERDLDADARLPTATPPSTPRATDRPPAWRAPVLGLAAMLALAVLIWRQPEPAPSAPAAQVPDRVQAEAWLAEGERLFTEGRWMQPEGASAADRFLAALPVVGESARVGLERTLDAVAAATERQLAAGDGAAAAESYDRAYALAERAAIPYWPAWSAFERRFAAAASSALTKASQSLDRAALERLTPALDRAVLVDQGLFQQRAGLGTLPPAGARVRDPGGPLLVLIPGRQGARAFALAVQEVTRGDYARFVSATGRAVSACRDSSGPLALLSRRSWREPGFDQDDAHPVVCVTAADAEAYASWLSRRTGARYRLPTRGEWTQAVGDTKAQACRNGNLLDAAARALRTSHDCNDGFAHTAPGARFAASGLGLRDVVGNVAEWSTECLRRAGAGGCAERRVLGSSFRDGPKAADPRRSNGQDPERGRPDLGFRVLRELALDDLPPTVP